MKFKQDRLTQLQIDPKDTDKCNVVTWSSGFKINRDSFDGKKRPRQLSQYNVFTDGSKMDDRTGAGLVLYKGNREISQEWYRLNDGSTVFQAEVAAIARAAEVLADMNVSNMRFVKHFVDSQAAILAVGNPHISSKLVARAVDSLNRLAEVVQSVTLTWIPAHKGHKGNELADELSLIHI